MGSDENAGFPADGEGPVRVVALSAFGMDVATVTNAAFAAFVQATGHVTDAERFGRSFVFYDFVSDRIRERGVLGAVAAAPWWLCVSGASWRHPEGPDSNIEARMDHPAVHTSWNDAVAYAHWARKRLPTEAEWEYAARGGLTQKRYPWGDELTPRGRFRCNIWQGSFPNSNTREDGYDGTAPAQSFTPNGYGLYNMSGNVWEWCQDWFGTAFGAEKFIDPTGPACGSTRVIRGGSYLCHDSYCNRYRVAARSHNAPDSSAGNLGFRCAV